MAGNHNGFVSGTFDLPIGPFDCVIDVAAILIINKWVVAIPECITERKYICLFKKDRHVSICMAGTIMVYVNRVPCKDECCAVIYEYCGAGTSRYRRHGPVPIIDVSSLGQVL